MVQGSIEDGLQQYGSSEDTGSQSDSEPVTNLKFSQAFKNTIMGITLCIVLAILLLNGFMIDPLYKLGVNLIDSFQTDIETKGLSIFMNIVSVICNTPGIVTIFLLQLLIVKHKLKFFMHISFFMMGIYFIAVFKQAYQQARPIWSSERIHRYQWFCPTDFGNPSGHSYVPFPLYEPLIFKYLNRRNYIAVAWIFMIFFGVVVPFSRMYLGVHSLNQVFFGFSLGLAWIVLLRYGLWQWFYKVYSCVFKIKKKWYLAFIVFLHLLMLVIPIIIFAVYLGRKNLDPEELAKLNTQCDGKFDSPKIQASMLEKCVLQSLIFGFLYGLFFLKPTQQQLLYFTGGWVYKDKKSAIFHCIAMIVCAAWFPVIIVFAVIPFLHQPYVQYFLLSLALTIAGFFLIYITPKIERKFEWITYLYTQLDDQNNRGKPTQLKEIKRKSQPLNNNEIYPMDIVVKTKQVKDTDQDLRS